MQGRPYNLSTPFLISERQVKQKVLKYRYVGVELEKAHLALSSEQRADSIPRFPELLSLFRESQLYKTFVITDIIYEII